MTETNIIGDMVRSHEEDVHSTHKRGGADYGKASQCRVTYWLIVAVIVLLIIIVIYRLAKSNLPKMLSNEGWILAVRDGCHFCTKQLELLGGDYPKLVEFSRDGKIVNSYSHKIPSAVRSPPGFPYWWNKQTHESRAGLQDLRSLTSMVS